MSRISTGATRPKVAKSSPSKSVAGKKRTAYSPKPVGDGVDRYRMIATAAYFRAEHRGFTGGNPVEDWLAAEAEIDRLYH
jgi:hypothetical protein